MARRPGFLALACLALASFPPPSPLQALTPQVEATRPGRVLGTVYDSTAGVRLPDADVFLLGTAHRSLTGPAGAFRIEDVPPGLYTAVFFHPRLAELGVSPGGVEVEVREGEASRVDLAVPSTHTVLAARCAFEVAPGAVGRGVPVVGRVTDAATEVGYPGARVILSWTGRRVGPTGRIEVTADDAGWFGACAAPSGVPVGVVAEFLGRSSIRREIVLERGRAAHVDLPLEDLGPATLAGRLVEAGSGGGVAGAAISLRGSSLGGVSGEDGSFRLEGIRPGEWTLVVEHGAYAPRSEPLFLTADQITNVVLPLAEDAVAVEPLEVTVERTPLVVRAMGGMVVEREQIERVAARVRDLADVLREQHVPGLLVRRESSGPCVGFTTGQVSTHRSGCTPVLVFIDGTRAANPASVFTMPPDAIERMVLYRPIEAGNLFGTGAANGVLEIFTRW